MELFVNSPESISGCPVFLFAKSGNPTKKVISRTSEAATTGQVL